MNLERLKRFVFLATHRNDLGEKDINITHVAEELRLPQPYLSNQIRQLEKYLGVELFIRTPRLELTTYGEIFLTEAQRLLAQVRQLEQFALQAVQGEIGSLTIGINTSISNGLLPQVLRSFRTKYPKVDLVLQEMLFTQSRHSLENYTIDVDFENLYNLQDINLNKEHSLTYEIVTEEALVMTLPSSHPQTQNLEVSLRDFASDSFILPCHKSVPALHNLIQMACMQVGFSPKVVQEAAWMTSVLGLVAGEIGVTLLPANVINLQRSGVVYRKIKEQLPMFQMAVVWRRNNQSKVLSNFLDIVREKAEEEKL
jgi:DNA-binding transcriptional LysR family regulator